MSKIELPGLSNFSWLNPAASSVRDPTLFGTVKTFASGVFKKIAQTAVKRPIAFTVGCVAVCALIGAVFYACFRPLTTKEKLKKAETEIQKGTKALQQTQKEYIELLRKGQSDGGKLRLKLMEQEASLFNASIRGVNLVGKVAKDFKSKDLTLPEKCRSVLSQAYDAALLARKAYHQVSTASNQPLEARLALIESYDQLAPVTIPFSTQKFYFLFHAVNAARISIEEPSQSSMAAGEAVHALKTACYLSELEPDDLNPEIICQSVLGALLTLDETIVALEQSTYQGKASDKRMVYIKNAQAGYLAYVSEKELKKITQLADFIIRFDGQGCAQQIEQFIKLREEIIALSIAANDILTTDEEEKRLIERSQNVAQKLGELGVKIRRFIPEEVHE